jgi:sec-independent protein translocase protein TatA
MTTTLTVPMAMFGLGVPELLIILAVVLLLFGGSRLAGLGKSTGRALKEFKEETKGLKPEDQPQAKDQPQSHTAPPPSQITDQPVAPTWQQPPSSQAPKPEQGDFRNDA